MSVDMTPHCMYCDEPLSLRVGEGGSPFHFSGFVSHECDPKKIKPIARPVLEVKVEALEKEVAELKEGLAALKEHVRFAELMAERC